MVGSTWNRYQKIQIRPGFACHLVFEDCSNLSNLSNAYKSIQQDHAIHPNHVTSLYYSMYTAHWFNF